MQRQLYLLLLILLIIPTLLIAAPANVRPMYPLPPIFTGLEDVPDNIPVVHPPYNLSDIDGIDILGDTVTVGDTWYEYQHNATIGRQIRLSDDGYIHMVWTKGEDEPSNNRHIYYNYIDPSGQQGWQGSGYAVESSQRGGFTSLAVGWDGIAFPAFHQVTGTNAHTAVATDFFPHAGAFLVYEIPWYNGQDLEYIWPRITMKTDGEILVTSVGNSDPTGASGMTWSMGTYDPLTYSISYTPQILCGPFTHISNEVGASRVSNRVGSAYCAPLENDVGGWDVHAMIDNDGLDLNFDNYWNVTKFMEPDLAWLPDTLMANADTLRAYCDVSMFYDMDDYCHIAFTTCRWFELEGGLVYWNASLIWHWSERWPNDYHVIANAFDPDSFVDCGGWNFRGQRPSLGQDPETGYLYCMYQEFDVDSTAISLGGWPSGEVKISVSTDNGATWSVGTNITNTVTPENAPPGECLSEAYPSMAEVVDGNCHVLYVLDLDAGAFLQTEGTITLNPIIYHKVPVDLIPTSPTVENLTFHVAHTGPVVSTEPEDEAKLTKFALQQNNPNPFNPNTTIQFSLETISDIRLSVYNLRGELISTLADGAFSAGIHTIAFDGSRLSSGLYVYRLETEGKCLQKKMLLLK